MWFFCGLVDAIVLLLVLFDAVSGCLFDCFVEVALELDE